jgi:hypothetical protein
MQRSATERQTRVFQVVNKFPAKTRTLTLINQRLSCQNHNDYFSLLVAALKKILFFFNAA